MFKSAISKKTAIAFATGAVGIALNLGLIKPVRAADFSFSFSNDPSNNVPGIVTGEILGLPDNGTGPAQEIIIESYPSVVDKYGSVVPPINIVVPPINIDISGPGTLANSFTVANGEITQFQFFGYTINLASNPVGCTDSNCSTFKDNRLHLFLNYNNPPSVNRLEWDTFMPDQGVTLTTLVGNTDGFAGVNFKLLTPNPTSVPEPGVPALAFATLAVGGFLLKKKPARSGKPQLKV